MTGANKCLFSEGKEHCLKHRMYAFPGEKAQFCSNHKVAGMVDVHNKRCEAPDCQKHPTYGPANGRARFCTKHKGPDMVDVHCRPCEFPGCCKHPHYAFEGDKARFCASHKEPGMVDVKHKRCHKTGCREMRVYETPTKKSRFCALHLDQWLSTKKPTARRNAEDEGEAQSARGTPMAKRQRPPHARDRTPAGNKKAAAAETVAAVTHEGDLAAKLGDLGGNGPATCPRKRRVGVKRKSLISAGTPSAPTRARRVTAVPAAAAAAAAISPSLSASPEDVSADAAGPATGAARAKAAGDKRKAAGKSGDSGMVKNDTGRAAAATGSDGNPAAGVGRDRAEQDGSLPPSQAAAAAAAAAEAGGAAAATGSGQSLNTFQSSRGSDATPMSEQDLVAAYGGGGDHRTGGGHLPSTGMFTQFSAPAPGHGRRRGRMDHGHDGAGGHARTPHGYADMDAEEMPPLQFSPMSDMARSPQGHRRHASFDPNTDCFSHFNFLGGGGSGGGSGDGGVLEAGRRGGAYVHPLGAPEGQAFTLPLGGGSGGGSYGGGSHRHVRGLSSGSVDLNVLAPVLAELRSSSGGNMGAPPFPILPFPQGIGSPSHHHHHHHHHPHAYHNHIDLAHHHPHHPHHQQQHFSQLRHPHESNSSQGHHYGGGEVDGGGAGGGSGGVRVKHELQERQQQHHNHHRDHEQQQQQQQHREPPKHQRAGCGSSTWTSTAGDSGSMGSPLPVVAEPGTPPHILSDDAASNNGRSPRKHTPQSSGSGSGTAAGPVDAAAAAAAAAVAAVTNASVPATGSLSGRFGHHKANGLPHSRLYSSGSVGSADWEVVDAGGGGGPHRQHGRRRSGGCGGGGGGREGSECSMAREYSQFYGQDPRGCAGSGGHHERLPSLLQVDQLVRNMDIDSSQGNRGGGGMRGAAPKPSRGDSHHSHEESGAVWPGHVAGMPPGQHGHSGTRVSLPGIQPTW